MYIAHIHPLKHFFLFCNVMVVHHKLTFLEHDLVGVKKMLVEMSISGGGGVEGVLEITLAEKNYHYDTQKNALYSLLQFIKLQLIEICVK